MKSLKEKGITYYLISEDYDGPNKDFFKEVINIDTLFTNEVLIMYDWLNGLCRIEDHVTAKDVGVKPMTALMLSKLLTDDDVIEWMTRSGEEDRLYAD